MAGENPIGKRFRFGPPTRPMIEVVGLVNDVRGTRLDLNPALTVYRPYWQEGFLGISLTVKTASEPIAMSSAIRKILRDMDAELPIPQFRTMDDIVKGSVAQRRFQMNLILLFALAAIVLASLGIYGVVSYAVAQRTNEIGIPSFRRKQSFRSSDDVVSCAANGLYRIGDRYSVRLCCSVRFESLSIWRKPLRLSDIDRDVPLNLDGRASRRLRTRSQSKPHAPNDRIAL